MDRSEASSADADVSIPIPRRNILNQLPDTTSSSSSSFSSSSSSDFVQQIKAAFKRHRPLGSMQSSSIGPRRTVLPKRNVGSNAGPDVATKNFQDLDRILNVKDLKVPSSVVRETQEDAYITPPSLSDTITKTLDESFNLYDKQKEQAKPVVGSKDSNAMSIVESHQLNVHRNAHVSAGTNAGYQGADGHLATGIENLTSYMDSLALTEMEWEAGNQGEGLAVVNHEHRKFQNMESDISLRSDVGATSMLAKRTAAAQDKLHQFRNFLSNPVTQSSAVGSSYATTTSIHSTSAPLIPTTYSSVSHRDENFHIAAEPMGEFGVNPQPLNHGNSVQPSHPLHKDTGRDLADHISPPVPSSTSAIYATEETKGNDLPAEQQSGVPRGSDGLKDPPIDKNTKAEGYTRDVTDGLSQAPMSKNESTAVSLDPSKAKQEKTVSSKPSASRKRNYDPDLFFKVNGKLYQRLGKIGSGGSSEVHKVISSDCTIYALKKIKLKGRDYATAFGFCQEIEYLNRLKGKNNIIQLIDYEVTDKALLREVMSGSISNKDGRVKDDGYIYMVLEYGEIDLAHMLSQKWKELDGTNQTIDENWLRFYWQQILLAVNTIHEERIVHSDLKPANFLLVKGSLKLIDFGIAKAIMSDTTNIQRDAQVGTLSYMSPEAFMCNESDANGNTIKCGRPSDIWSLGCILYQMVYGRTPFAEYKTFWAKFKVITDPNHEITYEPISNPWLLDIMKKCLAWDRNERWRIPQLLQHPFLVPQVPALQTSSSHDLSCKLLQLIAESSANDCKATMLCSQLTQLLREPEMPLSSESPISRDKQCKLLGQMSQICFLLQEQLAKSEAE